MNNIRVCIAISLALAALTSATLKARQEVDPHLIQVCYPGTLQSNGSADVSDVDFTAPCDVAMNLMYSCTGGNFSAPAVGANNNTFEFSNTTQRDCICSSQYWSVMQGCMDCLEAHGASTEPSGEIELASPGQLVRLSSTYCAASSTPTVDFFEFLGDAIDADQDPSSASPSSSLNPFATSSAYSDPLGPTETAVSYYYTPSISENSIAYVAEGTVILTSSGQSFSQTVVTNSAGIIVPTTTTTTSTTSAPSTSSTSSTPSKTSATTNTLSGTANSATVSHSEAHATWLPQPVLAVVAVAGVAAIL